MFHLIDFIISFIVITIFVILFWGIPNIISWFLYRFIILNSKKNSHKAAIVVGYCKWYDNLMWMNLHILLISLYYSFNKVSIVLFRKGKEEDIEKILKLKDYRSITFLGHGGKDYWHDSSDKKVSVKSYSDCQIEQVIQLSCVGKDYENFTKLATRKEISYCRNGKTNTLFNILFLLRIITLKRFKLGIVNSNSS